MGNWGSLGGGYGNVDMQMPMPVGKTNGIGPLTIFGQALMRQGGRMMQPGMNPEEDDPELHRLVAQAFGMLGRRGEEPMQPIPSTPTGYSSLIIRR